MKTISETPEKAGALALINEARNKNGLPAFHYSTLLEKASRQHNLYMIKNRTCSHFQQPGNPFFIGQSHRERALASSYSFRTGMENISCSHRSSSWKASIEGLMGAIYHRMAFLDFSTDEIGMARQEGRKSDPLPCKFTYVMGSTHAGSKTEKAAGLPDMAVYPWPGQRNVFPAFLDNETPDPTPYMKLSGLPVSVQFNPFLFAHVEIVSFTLKEAGSGKTVDLWRLDQYSDAHKKLTPLQFSWFPVRPLKRSMKYIVDMEYMANRKRYHRQWPFYTEPHPNHTVWSVQENNDTILAPMGQRVTIHWEHSGEMIRQISCQCSRCRPAVESFDTASLVVGTGNAFCEMIDTQNKKIRFILQPM